VTAAAPARFVLAVGEDERPGAVLDATASHRHCSVPDHFRRGPNRTQGLKRHDPNDPSDVAGIPAAAQHPMVMSSVTHSRKVKRVEYACASSSAEFGERVSHALRHVESPSLGSVQGDLVATGAG
jgi:hypothetical protein